jgi:hypothetical protein
VLGETERVELGSHARSASRPRWSAIGAVPSQAATGPADAVRDTYDIAGATIEANSLWGGKCILVDNRLRLRVDDNPAIEDADRITVEAWVNTLSWPVRAVVCPQGGQQPPLQLQRRLLLVPLWARQPAAVRYRRHARERQLGYIVGSYGKDAGPKNQRLYLNGTRVAE